MYVIVFVAVIIFAIVFLINLDPATANLITGIGFALADLSAMSVLFVPKALLLWQGADLDSKMNIILPSGKHINSTRILNGDQKVNAGDGVIEKPVYEEESQSKLGKNREANIKICKEQVMKWQRLLLQIENKALIQTNSNSNSKTTESNNPQQQGGGGTGIVNIDEALLIHGYEQEPLMNEELQSVENGGGIIE